MATRRLVGMALGVTGAMWLGACGEPLPEATGRSMDAPVAPGTSAAAQANQPPRIASVVLDPSDPVPGTPLQARVEASDPDGGPVHLRFVWSADGRRIAGEQAGSILVPDLPRGARLEVSVVASDGRAESEPATARAEVGNRPPAVTAVRLEPADGPKVGEEVVAVADATDPDGDEVELRYEWRVNELAREDADDGPRFDTSRLRRGDRVSVRVVASDGDEESERFTSPSLALGNAAPEITSLPPAGMDGEGVYRYAVEARDPDGDRHLRFALVEGPDGARVDPLLGTITWTPSLGQAGVHAIEVAVTDGRGGETKQRFEVTVREVVETVGAAQPAAAPAP